MEDFELFNPEDNDPVRTSLLDKILSFLYRLRKKSDDQQDYHSNSIFKRFFEDLNPDDPAYPTVKHAATLSDEAVRIARQRIILANQIQSLSEKLAEIECFNSLTEEEANHLKNLITRFLSLQKERNVLMNQLTDFDRPLANMFKLEEQATLSIPQIQEAEKNQRILRTDISYVEGEKADLEFEREKLENGLIFIDRFHIGMLVAFVVAAVALGYSYIALSMSIFISAGVLILVLVLVVSLLYMFKRRIVFELQLNIKKQNRAVEILNKKNVIFAHYTNFLNFVYKKYNVRNSQMLQNNLRDFGHYKHVTSRVDAIRKLMYETENEIETFLRQKKINHLNATVDKFARTINIEDKRRYYEELDERKQKTEKKLSELDTRHEDIWSLLVKLDEADETEERMINQVIQTYLDEVARLISPLEGGAALSDADQDGVDKTDEEA